MTNDVDQLDAETLRFAAKYELQVARAKAPIREKTEWIKWARGSFEPGNREACVICGKFQNIAQAHHLIPLEDQYDRGFQPPNQKFVWLCPSHHDTVHVFLKRDERKITAAISGDGCLSDQELDGILKVVGESGKSD